MDDGSLRPYGSSLEYLGDQFASLALQIQVNIYIYICVCVCVCLGRERNWEDGGRTGEWREKEGKREGGKRAKKKWLY